jgi:hypothetical protein
MEDSDKKSNSHVKMVYLATVLEAVSPVIIGPSENDAAWLLSYASKDQVDGQ